MIGRDYKVNNKVGISLALSGVAMLLFFYISFLGLGYFLEGYFEQDAFSAFFPMNMKADSLLVVYFIITFLYILLFCWLIYLMCSSKSRRNKRVGLPIEVFSGTVIFVMLLGGCVPFMKFLYVWEQEDALLEDVEEMRQSVFHVDDDYLAYVENRIDDFHKYGGLHYDKFSKSAAKSLRRRLVPLNFDQLRGKRADWLREMTDVSIWNPCTAHNVKAVMRASEVWTLEYSGLSSLTYQYEVDGDAVPVSSFKHFSSESCRNKWVGKFKEVEFPDWRALGATALLLLAVFSLYMSIDRPRSTRTGTHLNT